MTGRRPVHLVGRVALAAVALMLVHGSDARAAGDCAAPPAPVRDLELARYYTDAAGTVIDPGIQARNKAVLAPINAFLAHVVRDADTAVRLSKSAAAACALDWLQRWAQGEAWLGRMSSHQAEYQRKWDLAGVALAYLKVRPWASPAQRDAIEPWLIRFADGARAFFDDRNRRRNNHWYWLGLGVAGTALATGSERHWTMARTIFQDAARDIGPDGALQLEMDRGARALHYHSFSTTPLVVMAELAARRGEDWYALGDGALHRLVALTARGFVEPALFEAKAGKAQSVPKQAGAGWPALYAQRFPGRLPARLPTGTDRHRWLGGDVSLLVKALQAAASAGPQPRPAPPR